MESIPASVNIRGAAAAIRRRLRLEKNIPVQEDWAEACIQWLFEENKNELLSPDYIYGLVNEQWLMSDLHVISEASLPSNLPLLRVGQLLTGIYKLQVDVAINCSAPMYAQMQKTDVHSRKANDLGSSMSLQSSTIQSNIKQAEFSTPRRMLFFQLSDGVQEVNAIEYKFLSCFTDIVTPGLKVELKGPVACRDGILLLCPENITILGGSAEDLAQEYSRKQIFQKMLSANVRAQSVSISGAVDRRPIISRVNLRQDAVSEHGAGNMPNHVASEEKKLHDNANIANNDDAIDLSLEDDFVFDLEVRKANEGFHAESLAIQDKSTCLIKDQVSLQSLVNPAGTTVAASLAISANPTQNKIKNQGLFLLDFIQQDCVRELCIKAYIVTLLTKLDIDESSYNLSVCIDDGSASTSATLSSLVIEKQLGLSPTTILEHTKKSTTLPEYIKEMFVHYQQRLANLRWRMKVAKTEEQHFVITDMAEWVNVKG